MLSPWGHIYNKPIKKYGNSKLQLLQVLHVSPNNHMPYVELKIWEWLHTGNCGVICALLGNLAA